MDDGTLAQIDAWCAKRADDLSHLASDDIEAGKSLNAPNYRTLLGKHQAYMEIRSFIHGCRQRLEKQ